MTVYRSYRLWPCPLVRRQQRRLEGRALLLAVRTRNSSAEAARPRPEDPCCRGGRCRYLSALLQHSSRVLQLLQSGARVKLWRVRAGRMLASGPGSCWQSESEMMWPSHSRDRQPGTWCYCDARTTVYSITFEADGVHWRTCIYAREQ